MRDSQITDFSGRLRRIEKIHRKGGGFEATGTLGQSFYTRELRRGQSRTLLRPLLSFVTVIIVLKSFLLASIGAEAYADKIIALKEGGVVEQIGSFVMSVDPISAGVAQMITPLIG